MTEQATWIPLPRRRGPKAKLPDVLNRANRLIDWYEVNKPNIRRIAVTSADYDALIAAIESDPTTGRVMTTLSIQLPSAPRAVSGRSQSPALHDLRAEPQPEGSK